MINKRTNRDESPPADEAHLRDNDFQCTPEEEMPPANRETLNRLRDGLERLSREINERKDPADAANKPKPPEGDAKD